jgi:class 3 adenylate cyclase
VRIGLNAGEPVGEGSEMFGGAVQKVARVCIAAVQEEILVTPVIRALVEGKGFEFHDRGDYTLKGFTEPVRLYAVKC